MHFRNILTNLVILFTKVNGSHRQTQGYERVSLPHTVQEIAEMKRPDQGRGSVSVEEENVSVEDEEDEKKKEEKGKISRHLLN